MRIPESVCGVQLNSMGEEVGSGGGVDVPLYGSVELLEEDRGGG